jgi:hypothetical protein
LVKRYNEMLRRKKWTGRVDIGGTICVLLQVNDKSVLIAFSKARVPRKLRVAANDGTHRVRESNLLAL